MTGVTFSVDDGDVAAALGRMLQFGRDPSAALKILGEILVNSTKERIRTTKSSPEGVAWAPLSPAYARRKRGPGILEETGELRDGIRWQLEGVTELLVGTNRKHARVHQFGATIQQPARTQSVFHTYDAAERSFSATFVKRRRANLERTVTVGAHVIRIPARPFLGVSAEDRTRGLEAISDLLGGLWEPTA